MKKILMALVFVFMFVSIALAGPIVTMEWTPNSEPDLAGYNIYRSLKDGGPYEPIGTIPAPTATYTDSTCEFDVMYYWVVTAFDNNDNESGYSNQVSNLTDQPDVTPPGNPQDVNVTVHITVK